LCVCVCLGYFWNRVSQTISQDWLWTVILLISAFWVARIIGVSLCCPAKFVFFITLMGE
jgi:hypothetical protein